MRAGRVTVLAVLCSSSPATFAIADDGAGVRAGAGAGADAEATRRLEVSGFAGYSSLGDSELGNSWAPEQVPGAAAVVGARLGWLAVPDLARRGPIELSLAVEAELALAAASTGASSDALGRMSYFAPVIGWRAHARLRQPLWPERLARKLALHAVLGAGGATVASASPFMANDTDPLAYAGLGATYAITGRWQLRLDGRQGVMPGRASSATRVSELSLGLSAALGGATRRAPAPPPTTTPPTPPTTTPTDAKDPAIAGAGVPAQDDAKDTDGDGVPDRLDRCPAEPESQNGVDDGDGCPEPDPDSDGIVGAADACPTEAEDADRFEDEDGCPDRDNDRDGVEDARDTCPMEPETRNGIADADGCPDVIPEAVTRALAGAAAVRFERGRARVTPAAKKALQPVLAALQAQPDLALSIAGTPERAGGDDLAKRRAEAVKWHLVDLGIAEDRLETSVGPAAAGAGAAAPPIVLKLR